MATTLPLPPRSVLLSSPENPLNSPRDRALLLPDLLLGTFLPRVPPNVLMVLWWVPCRSTWVALVLLWTRPISLPWCLLARGGTARCTRLLPPEGARLTPELTTVPLSGWSTPPLYGRTRTAPVLGIAMSVVFDMGIRELKQLITTLPRVPGEVPFVCMPRSLLLRRLTVPRTWLEVLPRTAPALTAT